MWANYFNKESAKVRKILKYCIGRNPTPEDMTNLMLIRKKDNKTHILRYKGKVISTWITEVK